MTKKYIIATDLGSQSTKTSIYDETGSIVGTLNQYTHIIDEGFGGLVYNGDEAYKQTTDNIRNLVELTKINPVTVEAISFSGMGGGIIGVDQEWNPTMKYSNPIDTRDHKHFLKMMKKNGKLIRSVSGTGNPMGANKVVWVKEEFPNIYKRTRKFMMLTQYVQGKFCAFKADDAIWEFASIALSGMADSKNYKWSDDICKAIDIDINKLPKVVEPTEIIGKLSKRAALDCGLVQGIPVIAGSFDKVCDTVGSGSNEVGFLVDNAATYPALLTTVDRFLPDIEFRRLECHPSAEKDKWLTHTYIVGGGLSHNWFKKEFIGEGRFKKDNRNILEILDEKAFKLPPGSYGLLFFPHLGGRVTPFEPNARGIWAGFTWSHSVFYFYKSMLESIAFEHAITLQITRKKYPEIKYNQVRVLGGGAKSEVWNQIKSDILGIPYFSLNRSDTATLGAAIIGGKAVGIFDNLTEVTNRIIKIKKVFNPRPEYHEFYQDYVNTYYSINNDLKLIYNKLSNLRKRVF